MTIIDAHTHAFLAEDLQVLEERLTLLDDHLPDESPHKWQIIGGCKPPQIARAALAHPGVNFIAAHGGSLYDWEALDQLLELPNVYFDISYLMGLLEPAQVVEIIRRKGPDHVIYGSDAPWRPARACREWFEYLPLSPGERQQVASATLLALLEAA